jgi:CrcB protein
VRNFLLVGLGGFFGATARYAIGLGVRSYVSHPFPLHTLVVNLTGCFAVGLLFEYLRDHAFQETASLLALIGFLGAFTTFSAFGLETVQLARTGLPALALLNIGVSLVLCLAAVAVGVWLGSILR